MIKGLLSLVAFLVVIAAICLSYYIKYIDECSDFKGKLGEFQGRILGHSDQLELFRLFHDCGEEWFVSLELDGRDVAFSEIKYESEILGRVTLFFRSPKGVIFSVSLDGIDNIPVLVRAE